MVPVEGIVVAIRLDVQKGNNMTTLYIILAVLAWLGCGWWGYCKERRVQRDLASAFSMVETLSEISVATSKSLGDMNHRIAALEPLVNKVCGEIDCLQPVRNTAQLRDTVGNAWRAINSINYRVAALEREHSLKNDSSVDTSEEKEGVS